MTADQQAQIEREYNDAVATGDSAQIMRAVGHAVMALVDCQRKTADRVKEMRVEADRAKHRIEGVKLAARVARFVATLGGGALLMKILQSVQL